MRQQIAGFFSRGFQDIAGNMNMQSAAIYNRFTADRYGYRCLIVTLSFLLDVSVFSFEERTGRLRERQRYFLFRRLPSSFFSEWSSAFFSAASF